jgi:hypothetical protein
MPAPNPWFVQGLHLLHPPPGGSVLCPPCCTFIAMHAAFDPDDLPIQDTVFALCLAHCHISCVLQHPCTGVGRLPCMPKLLRCALQANARWSRSITTSCATTATCAPWTTRAPMGCALERLNVTRQARPAYPTATLRQVRVSLSLHDADSRQEHQGLAIG